MQTLRPNQIELRQNLAIWPLPNSIHCTRSIVGCLAFTILNSLSYFQILVLRNIAKFDSQWLDNAPPGVMFAFISVGASLPEAIFYWRHKLGQSAKNTTGQCCMASLGETWPPTDLGYRNIYGSFQGLDLLEQKQISYFVFSYYCPMGGGTFMAEKPMLLCSQLWVR